MKEKIEHIATVCEYNELMSQETLHPLVAVVDWSKCPPMRHMLHTFGFYAMFVKDVNCGDMRYGRNTYDYQEGTLMFLAPGQVSGCKDDGTVVQPKGYALLFHPDLIKGTSLGKNMKQYTFFSYESREALHVSEQERKIVMECLSNISLELNHAIDKHSKYLICNNIELLLNYCVRFYDRQFVTRENSNKDILTEFEDLVDKYFANPNIEESGLPTVAFFAEKLNLSANYFGDLVKKETGKTAQEYIQYKLIDLAKDKVLGTTKPVSEIAYELGFKYPQHFTRLFTKRVGMSPSKYRLGN